MTIAYDSDVEPEVVAIPCGTFADPGILAPHRTVTSVKVVEIPV